jgi:hypothetical protein
MSINLTIKSLKTTDNLGAPSVVTEIQYIITKGIASIEGFVNLDFSQLTNDTYIPTSEITEDIVKGWVLNAIGERITSIEDFLDNEIELIEGKSKIISNEIPLPWEAN